MVVSSKTTGTEATGSKTTGTKGVQVVAVVKVQVRTGLLNPRRNLHLEVHVTSSRKTFSQLEVQTS